MSGKRALADVIPIGSRGEAAPRKRRYTRLTDAARERLDAELRDLVADGAGSKADYRRVAEAFGISTSLVEKRVGKLRHAQVTHGHRERVTGNCLPEDVKVQLVAHRQLLRTWRHYFDAGEYQASYSTFRRQVHNALGANTVRGLTRGIGSMRRGTFEKLDRPEFMQGLELDLVYLRAPLAGLPEDAKPVAALVSERSTGLVLSSWIWPDDTVSAEDVMVLLAETFRGRVFEFDGEAVFVGGVPDFLRCDNGGHFTAVQMGKLLNPLAVRVIPSGSHRSNELGAHERKHGVLRQDLLALLPGSQDGPRDHRGVLLPDPRELVGLDEARDLLDRWAWRYNTRDDGKGSRMDAWVEGIRQSQGLLPRLEEPGTLARFAVERPRTARLDRGYGLEMAGAHYTCPELRRRSEKRFVVAQWLRDTRTIEVFAVDGTYVGTAVRNGELTAAESGTMVALEREDELEVKGLIAVARALAPMPHLPGVPVMEPAPEPGGDAEFGDVDAENAAARDVEARDDDSGLDGSGLDDAVGPGGSQGLRSVADALRRSSGQIP